VTSSAWPRSGSRPSWPTSTTVRQGQAKGLAMPCCAPGSHVGREPFAVLLGTTSSMRATRCPGDDRHCRSGPAVGRRAARGGTQEDQSDGLRRSSVRRSVAVGGTARCGSPGLVENPTPPTLPATSPSSDGMCSTRRSSRCRANRTGARREIQLTDALATLAAMPPAKGGGVYGVVFTGRRYDTGRTVSTTSRPWCASQPTGRTGPRVPYVVGGIRAYSRRVRSVQEPSWPPSSR